MRNDEKSDRNAKGMYIMCPSDSTIRAVSVRGRSASSDVSSDISPSPLYIPPHHR